MLNFISTQFNSLASLADKRWFLWSTVDRVPGRCGRASSCQRATFVGCIFILVRMILVPVVKDTVLDWRCWRAVKPLPAMTTSRAAVQSTSVAFCFAFFVRAEASEVSRQAYAVVVPCCSVWTHQHIMDALKSRIYPKTQYRMTQTCVSNSLVAIKFKFSRHS